jgi:hypothetical protein
MPRGALTNDENDFHERITRMVATGPYSRDSLSFVRFVSIFLELSHRLSDPTRFYRYFPFSF